MYYTRVLIISFLAAIFINRYKIIYAEIDAYRYQRIIRLKNKVAYDKHVGCITLSFFPFNILMVPFIPVVVMARSSKISDFLLKIQYCLLMVIYSTAALAYVVVLAPLLYFKALLNSVFILLNNNLEEYKY